MILPRPFRIAVPDETLDRIYARVADYAWHEMPRGGHFAALEQPELFVEDLRAFARSLRS